MEEQNTNITMAGFLAIILADIETTLIIKTGKTIFTDEEILECLKQTATHVFNKFEELGFDWTEELKFSEWRRKVKQN